MSHPAVTAAAEASPAVVATRIQAVKDALDRLGTALNTAERNFEQAVADAARHQKALATASQRQAVLRHAFAGRASAMYTMGSGSMFEMILGSQDLNDFVNRYSYIELVGTREKAQLEELTALRRRAGIESAALSATVKIAAAQRSILEAARGELLGRLSELQSLQNLLVALGGSGNSGARLSRAPSGFVCPVAGPHYVLNNFGDPRPGGPHTGDDIQAPYGTPTVSVLPTTVVATPYGGWIGIGAIIRDAMGNEWLYAHMQREYVTVGQNLKAGQLIGRVGCTGNCTGPHLHFEYHPHGGAPANPYRILSSAC